MSVQRVKLPHGSVPTGGVSEPSVRDALMKLNENIARLMAAHNELVDAVNASEGE